ncbi:hypothetical protein HHK36_016627 [Tetracentron sinense]|uniref:Cyclic nucleotide-binding domain-containing protein n=1 Tax=Tetracentron sinense TaxID=13715 RepID=A0A834Z127_TETSI|nr:hypothetical protein HHK36_016627 [Tetracentron sinense]
MLMKFQDDLEVAKFTASEPDNVGKPTYKIDGSSQISEASSRKSEKVLEEKTGRSLKAKGLSRVFSEDYGRVKKKILDPRGPVMNCWNKIFLVASIISLFVDPLFLYLPRIRVETCSDVVMHVEVILTVIRSAADVFYIIQIFVRFRTAYVAPSSRVLGRGELVIDPSKIASRYLGRDFWIDLFAALPLPQRLEACWNAVCIIPNSGCDYGFFDCHMISDSGRAAWLEASNITTLCDPNNDFYPFGIYGDAVTYSISTAICRGGAIRIAPYEYAIQDYLIFLSIKTYLQSTSVRLEEWRVKRTDTEQWMRHRQLPPELRQCVRRYNQYKWVATRGVDEEAILQGLPMDLRRDIKRHLCLDLLRGVPLFDQMDEQMLDAICDRMKPALNIQGTCLVREGDPVNEMLFIIRGHLDSYTTNGGRTGFFNSCRIGPGDFCGEELLTWALDPRPSVALPSSTRTVEAFSEVEGFALTADDLKFVALQFRRLHSKQLRHKFRFYSHQWRTWAACFIQAAWRRYKRRRDATELKAMGSPRTTSPEPAFKEMELFFPPPGSGLAVYAARFTASIRKGGSNRYGSDSVVFSSLRKPEEPDFTVR